jgi:hypothetical protein
MATWMVSYSSASTVPPADGSPVPPPTPGTQVVTSAATMNDALSGFMASRTDPETTTLVQGCTKLTDGDVLTVAPPAP